MTEPAKTPEGYTIPTKIVEIFTQKPSRWSVMVGLVIAVAQFVLLHFYRKDQHKIERRAGQDNKLDWLITTLYYFLIVEIVLQTIFLIVIK